MRSIAVCSLFICFIFLAACSPDSLLINNGLQEGCCQQCLAAANRDPSGYDIRIKPCSQYPPEYLSENCFEYLSINPFTVGECQKLSEAYSLDRS